MTWFDSISKKKEKGMRKLEDALLAEGYKIVEYSGGKHTKIKVKRLSEVNDPNAQEIQTTVSHEVTNGRKNAAMVVNEIINKFAGRKRRGQGSFKLSNDKINTWQSILKIQPRDNPLSDKFEPPEIPPRDMENRNPKGKPRKLINNFPIAKKLFQIRNSTDYKNILRIEGNYWIYDNSYFALAFNTQFDKSIIKEHDFKSTATNVDLFLDAILEFFLTIDSNYEKRTEAIEKYATAIYDFLLLKYKGTARYNEVIEGTVSEAMSILESFEGKVKPIEVVIRETIDDIKEGDTEINWETLSELYDSDYDFSDLNFFSRPLEGSEEAESEFGMAEEDFEELSTEEELRRRRNRG